MHKKVRKRNFALEILMWVLVLLVLIPFFLLVWNSLKSKPEANLMNFSMPSEIRWDNYAYVWERSDMLMSFFNSVLIAIVPTTVSTLASSMAAFVLSRHRTRINKTIYYAFLLGLVLPVQMLAIMRILKTLDLMYRVHVMRQL